MTHRHSRGRVLAMLVTAWLAAGCRGPGEAPAVAARGSDDDTVPARIVALRAGGRYADAAALAESRARSLQFVRDVPPWRRADAMREAATLRHLARLPSAAREEMADADAAGPRADSLRAAGSLPAADWLLGMQLAARRHWLGPEHEETAASMSAQARVRLALGDVPEALALTREALRVRRQRLGPRHPGTAESLDQLGVALKTAGGSRDEPMRLYREALVLRNELLGPESAQAVETLMHIGNLYRVRHEPDSALAVFQRVIGVARVRGGVSEDQMADVLFSMAMTVTPLGRWEQAEPWLRESAERWRRLGPAARPSLARALGAEGLALRHLGRPAEAESVLVESVRLFEELRREAPPGWSRSVAVPLVSYDLLAGAQLERGAGDEAWRSMERGLARALLEDLAHSGAVDTSAWWDHALARVQRALGPDAAVIGWLTTRPGASSEEYPYWCWCVRSRGPVIWRRVDAPPGGGRAPADLRLDRLRRELVRAASWPLRVHESAAFDRLARDAYAVRVAPLEPVLRGVRRLVVVSPDLLHGTPLECLVDSTGTSLGDRFVVSYAPSALLWAESERRRERRTAPAAWRALLVGDPAPGAGPSGGSPLDAARREIRDLSTRLPSPTVLVGADAGAPQLRQLARTGALSGYQLIHFATHAKVDETWLGESALVLAWDAADTTATHINASEIASTWRLDADLVTLAACETVVGPASKTEGFLGLQQALLAAGARHLLVSAWRVDDEATARLMARFYERLLALRRNRAGEAEAEALADARRWLRAWTAPDGSRPYAHPAYWAGFVLVDGGFAGPRPATPLALIPR